MLSLDSLINLLTLFVVTNQLVLRSKKKEIDISKYMGGDQEVPFVPHKCKNSQDVEFEW